MTIKVWDYLKEYEAEREDILAGVEKVFRSGKLILGQSVLDFESAFSAYCQMRFGIGVDNATNAAFLALKALGIGVGDEVITVPNTAVPTVSAIVAAGATPVFVEIDPATYLMDVERIASAITPRTRAIIPVHLYGQCVDMDPVIRLAQAHGFHILEDCAQCHGATYKGRKAGSMSSYSTFSFYPTKPLGCFGDAGMVLTNDEQLDKKMRRLRFYGMEKTYYAEEHGYNSRLDELQAEILLRRLARLEGYIAQRQELAARYDQLLSGTTLRLPQRSAHGRHVFYVYVVAHPERERIMAALAENEILVNISYPYPIHTMRGYTSLGYKEGDFPLAEAAARQIFSLPMYPSLSFEEQDRVCQVLREVTLT